MGEVHLAHPPEGVDYHQQALTIARQVGYRNGEGWALHNLGLTYHSLGDYRQAIDYHQQALAIAREISDLVIVDKVEQGAIATIAN